MNSLPAQFKDAIRVAGMEPPAEIAPGKWHRFPGVDKSDGNTAAWCTLFEDGLGGCFGDWSSGLYETWQAKREKPLSRSEQEAFGRQVEDATKRTEEERQQKIETAQRIFNEALSNTHKECQEALGAYFAGRGLQEAPIPPSLRYAAGLRHPAGSTHPAMVAQVVGLDGPLGLHRTFLTPDCRTKAGLPNPRAALGPIGGGCVRLGEAGKHVLVGEGIETCMTAQAASGIPAWAVLGASNLPGLRFPGITARATILAENDSAGLAAILNTTPRWEAEKVSVTVARPTEGKDFNDVVRGEGGIERVKQAISEALGWADYLRGEIAEGRINTIEESMWRFLAWCRTERVNEFGHIREAVKKSEWIKIKIADFDNKIKEEIKNKPESREDAGNNKDAEIIAFVEELKPFQSTAGEVYVDLGVDGIVEYHRLNSQTTKDHILLKYEEQKGEILKGINQQSVFNSIGPHSLKKEKHKVCRSIGFYGEDIYFLLGWNPFKAVKITKNGWGIVEETPVRFEWLERDTIPDPEKGGSMEDLERIINVKTKEGRALITGWLLTHFQEKGGYPILALHGEPGSAKTTTAKALGRLLYGSDILTTGINGKTNQLWVTVKNASLPIFDNISWIPADISDTLCLISTGGAQVERELYTNDSAHTIEGKKPVILTSITNNIGRGDLADRTKYVELARIPKKERRTEGELEKEFQKIHPKLLGSLLDMVVTGLKTLPLATYTELPRPADAWEMAFACHGFRNNEDMLGQPLYEALEISSREGLSNVIESTAVAETLIKAIEKGEFGFSKTTQGKSYWTGTGTELLTKLDGICKGVFPPRWPRNAAALSRQLVPALSAIREAGIGIRQLPRTKKSRRWEIIYNEPEPSTKEPKDTSSTPDTRGEDAHVEPFTEARETYACITTQGAFEEWIRRLQAVDMFAIDTETTSKDALAAELVGFSFAVEGRAAYVPLAHDYPEAPTQLERGQVLAALKPLLEDPSRAKVGHNIKYDMKVLRKYGVSLKGTLEDTLAQTYVLYGGIGKQNLDALAKKYLNHRTITYKDVAGKKTFNQVPLKEATEYAAEDAHVTLRLYRAFSAQLQEPNKQDLLRLYENVDRPLIPVLAAMEYHGVLIDPDVFKKESEVLGREIEGIKKKVYASLGRKEGTLNLNSPQQIGKALHDLGIPVEKNAKGNWITNKKALKKLKKEGHKIAGYILEYRHLTILKRDFVDKLPTLANPNTGRIHGTFNAAGTATGRLSAANPNLQNIPKQRGSGVDIRSGFIAPPGYVIVTADYSQIELRVLAECAGETVMQGIFKEGGDIHRMTAASMYKVSPGEVSKEQRAAAKVVNFGIIYGMSAYRLAEELKVSEEEAQDYIDSYFQQYPKIREYQRETLKTAGRYGVVQNHFGRRRYLPNLRSSDLGLYGKAERQVRNTPIQGTAAEIIKLAMIELHAEIIKKHPRTHLLIQVHDELVLETPEEDAETIVDLVKTVMEKPWLKGEVTMDVDVERGSTW